MTLASKLAVNKKAALVLLLLSLMAPCVLKIQPGIAGSQTIVVPDDYPTISAAIGNATGGDTIFVKKGTYEEKALEINKTISLIGEDAESTIINLHPPYNETLYFTVLFRLFSDAIAVAANDVKLSAFTIIITPGGYISISGNRSQILDNKIELGQDVHPGITVIGSYNKITGNTIAGGDLTLNSSLNLIAGNSMAQERLYLMNGSSNVISKNTFNGLFLGYPDSICSNNIFSGNAIKGPGVWGIWIGPQGTNNLFYANHIEDFHSTDDGGYYSDKDGGVAFDGNQIAPAANNTFYHNNFVNNKKSVDLVTDQIVRGNFWDDGKEGNYWDDYNGTDSGKDGIGDTPYVINENNQDRYPLMAPFDVSSVTVELPEWASPSPTPIPTPIDAKPLPTTLLVAVAIVACVFGFGLIVNIVTGKRKSSNRQGN